MGRVGIEFRQRLRREPLGCERAFASFNDHGVDVCRRAVIDAATDDVFCFNRPRLRVKSEDCFLPVEMAPIGGGSPLVGFRFGLNSRLAIYGGRPFLNLGFDFGIYGQDDELII